MELQDSAARTRIREDLDHTLVVEAAAGTGKTTELVARIVALVRRGYGLERILAVTFTDKAAGEMKLRLRAELEKARTAANGVEHERFTFALARLEVAQIGTIHSLCGDLLRERPIEARVDPLFDVAAGDAAERLFDQAFDAWFQRIVGDPPEGIRRMLRRKGRGRDAPGQRQVLRDAGRALSEHRDFDGPWRRDPFERRAAIDRVMVKIGEIATLSARAQRPEDWCAKSLAEISRWHAELLRREATRERDEDGLEAALASLCREKWWGWKGSGKWFAEGLARADVLALRDALKAELERFVEDAEKDLAACLHAELRPLVDEYEALKARSGRLDFLDLLLRARDLVRDDAEVRAELQSRFSHLLVDEFQDTDPLQAEILLLLSADDPAESDWARARPIPGKLFLVGDPKQSIYRFRRADIALYEDVKTRLVARGAELLHLSTSFRSVPSLQRAVNAAFAPRMTGASSGQASYVALQPCRPEPAGRPTVVALPAPKIYGDRGSVVNFRIEQSYPEAVAGFVDFLINKSGWTVTERDKPDLPVPIGARHICLLFKRLQSFGADTTREYVRGLEARRIPHMLVGGRSYHAREEILAMRNAATAIEWPDDELAVFATLRGPFFALGDDALLLFHERQGRLLPTRTFDQSALGSQEREVAAALGLLRELHLTRNRRPIAHTLSRLLEATRAHAGIAIWPTGEQALANVLQIVELARRFEAETPGSFRGFVERLLSDAERGESGEAAIVEEGTEGVRIMSVHKAKGLEFPVVILCDPCAPATLRNPSRHVVPERKLWSMPLAGCTPAELADERAAVLQRDGEEAVRVAYVAATRARDLLVVPQTGDGELEGWLDVLNPVLLPRPLERRTPRVAAGCPPFGKETVLDRPDGAFSALSVSPGLHSPQVGDHEVVWWDPAALDLGHEGEGGIRGEALLTEDAGSRELSVSVARAHEEWKAARADAIARGQEASLRVVTPTSAAASAAAARPCPATSAAVHPLAAASGPAASGAAAAAEERPAAATAAAAEVRYEHCEGRDPARPRGKRFGTLVHATLAAVALDAGTDAIALSVRAEGRMVGATEIEIAAAASAVAAALRHPILVRARNSQDYRRETPVFLRQPDGTIVEGIADLAFREPAPASRSPGEPPAAWTIVDFKTDARAEDHPQYLEQLRHYCAAVTAATGAPAKGVILTV